MIHNSATGTLSIKQKIHGPLLTTPDAISNLHTLPRAPTAEATSSLDDRAEGNARKTQADEGVALKDVSTELRILGRRLTASEGEFWQQAMFCLHFWLTRSWMGTAMIATGLCQYGSSGVNETKRTLEVELGALVEQTETLCARSTTDEVLEGTGEDTLVDIGNVTGVGGLVAARELSLVTTLLGSLLDGHVVRNGEADVGVALVANTIASSVSIVLGQGSHRDGESEDSSAQRKLHCDGGVGFERVETRRELEV
jgi:hypothetical protein